ncbi:NfeD family protein [bacterium]|nr:NfeD family protein [bacterium]
MPYWIWLTIGVSCFIFELFLPFDFFLFFIGAAALVTGGGVAIGLLEPLSWQMLCFALLTPLFLFSLRSPLKNKLLQGAPSLESDLENALVEVLDEIPPGARGKGSLRGTQWTVENRSGEILRAGEHYQVHSSHGTRLVVQTEKGEI